MDACECNAQQSSLKPLSAFDLFHQKCSWFRCTIFLYSARTHDCKLGCNCKASRTIGVHMYTHREMIIIYFLYNWHFTYSFWFAFYYTSETLWKEKKQQRNKLLAIVCWLSNEQWASTRVSGIHCKLIVTLFRQARILFVLHTCPLSVVSFVPSILFDFLEHLICSCVLLSSFPFPLYIYIQYYDDITVVYPCVFDFFASFTTLQNWLKLVWIVLKLESVHFNFNIFIYLYKHSWLKNRIILFQGWRLLTTWCTFLTHKCHIEVNYRYRLWRMLSKCINYNLNWNL